MICAWSIQLLWVIGFWYLDWWQSGPMVAWSKSLTISKLWFPTWSENKGKSYCRPFHSCWDCATWVEKEWIQESSWPTVCLCPTTSANAVRYFDFNPLKKEKWLCQKKKSWSAKWRRPEKNRKISNQRRKRNRKRNRRRIY